MNDTFSLSVKFLKNIIYTGINKHSSFLHVKSVFNDAWYNYIVPTVSSKDFSWEVSEKVIEEEKQKGFDVSYYIPEKYLKQYENILKNRGLAKLGDDTYMVFEMKKMFEEETGKFEEVNRKNIKMYISMAQDCFPYFSNERKYCEHFYQLAKDNKDKDKLFSNLLLMDNTKYASFASIYASRKNGLAYLHNDGTIAKSRRKGYHTSLVRKRCNMAYDLGIKNIYTILEENSGSYYSYSKLGFKPVAKYHLFTK